MQKFIVFKLGNKEFGVEVEKVVEILNSQKICPLPELKDFIAGVITVRGEVIPLIDMRKRFGIQPFPKKERTVIVKAGSEKVGLIVDEVKDITAFLPEEIMKPPVIFKGLKTEYLIGLGKKEGMVVILLNLENILTAEEKMILKTDTIQNFQI